MYYDLSVHVMTCARAGQKSLLSSNLSLIYMRLQQLAKKKKNRFPIEKILFFLLRFIWMYHNIEEKTITTFMLTLRTKLGYKNIRSIGNCSQKPVK